MHLSIAAQTITINEAQAVASASALATMQPLMDVLNGVISVPVLSGIVSSAAATTVLAKRPATYTGGTPQPTRAGPLSNPNVASAFQSNSA